MLIEDTRFVTGESWLGWFAAAEAGSGLRWLLLGDDEDSVVVAVLERDPHAIPQEQTAARERLQAAALRALDPLPTARRPRLDPRGTGFQQTVWAALRRIPAGEMRSYAQLARAIGRPTSVRAVAGACAANPIAVAIPCHRVCRSDGGLGGYRWGLWRKCCLLGREAVLANPSTGSGRVTGARLEPDLAARQSG